MHLAVPPGVDNQHVIDVNAHAIIHRGGKAVGAGSGKVDAARPAGRK